MSKKHSNPDNRSTKALDIILISDDENGRDDDPVPIQALDTLTFPRCDWTQKTLVDESSFVLTCGHKYHIDSLEIPTLNNWKCQRVGCIYGDRIATVDCDATMEMLRLETYVKVLSNAMKRGLRHTAKRGRKISVKDVFSKKKRKFEEDKNALIRLSGPVPVPVPSTSATLQNGEGTAIMTDSVSLIIQIQLEDPNISELHLKGMATSDLASVDFSKLAQSMPNLRVLKFDCHPPSRIGLFQNLQKLEKLECLKLRLSTPSICEELLASDKMLKRLTALEIYGTERCIDERLFKACSSLKILGLFVEGKVSSRSVKSMLQEVATHLSGTLEEFETNLFWTKGCIANILKLCNLKKLRISYDGIDGLDEWPDLAELSNLSEFIIQLPPFFDQLDHGLDDDGYIDKMEKMWKTYTKILESRKELTIDNPYSFLDRLVGSETPIYKTVISNNDGKITSPLEMFAKHLNQPFWGKILKVCDDVTEQIKAGKVMINLGKMLTPLRIEQDKTDRSGDLIYVKTGHTGTNFPVYLLPNLISKCTDEQKVYAVANSKYEASVFLVNLWCTYYDQYGPPNVDLPSTKHPKEIEKMVEEEGEKEGQTSKTKNPKRKKKMK